MAVELLGDRVKAEALGSQVGDALGELGRCCGETGTSAGTAGVLGVPSPAVDLADQRDGASALWAGRVKARAGAEEVGAGAGQPIEQADHFSKRAGHRAQLRDEQRLRVELDHQVKGLTEVGRVRNRVDPGWEFWDLADRRVDDGGARSHTIDCTQIVCVQINAASGSAAPSGRCRPCRGGSPWRRAAGASATRAARGLCP